MPAGMPKIEVTFLIDANGILQVQAKELRTGKAASIEVKPTYGLSEAEVTQMVEDSFTYAEDDVNARLLDRDPERGRDRDEPRRARAQAGRSPGRPRRARIRSARPSTRCGPSSAATDRDAIRERTIELNQATERLAEAMMDAALKRAVTSRRADEILEEK